MGAEEHVRGDRLEGELGRRAGLGDHVKERDPVRRRARRREDDVADLGARRAARPAGLRRVGVELRRGALRRRRRVAGEAHREIDFDVTQVAVRGDAERGFVGVQLELGPCAEGMAAGTVRGRAIRLQDFAVEAGKAKSCAWTAPALANSSAVARTKPDRDRFNLITTDLPCSSCAGSVFLLGIDLLASMRPLAPRRRLRLRRLALARGLDAASAGLAACRSDVGGAAWRRARRRCRLRRLAALAATGAGPERRFGKATAGPGHVGVDQGVGISADQPVAGGEESVGAAGVGVEEDGVRFPLAAGDQRQPPASASHS